MDKYNISQTPSGKKKTAKPTLARRKQSRSLDPRLALGGIVLVAALILVAMVWLRFSANKPEAASGQAAKGPKSSLSASKRDAVTKAVENNQPSGLSGYYASRVRVIMSGYNQFVSAAEVNSIIGNALGGTQGGWNWHVPPGDLSNWQTGPYGDNFTGDVVVGVSDDGTVIVIGFDGDGNINTIVIIPATELNPTTPPADGGTTTPGTTPGGGTSPGGTTPPTPPSPPSTIPFSD